MECPRLPLGRYRLIFEADGVIDLGCFPGSAWRGALGHSLKRTVCVTRAPACDGCLLYHSCLYPYFFDTPPAADAPKMRRYTNAPHPFILTPARHDEEGHYRLGAVLVGQANRHLNVFVHALRHAASQGKGVRGQHLQLVRIEQESVPGGDAWHSIHECDGSLDPMPPASPTIPPAPRGCTVRIETPLRVKRDGRHVGPDDFRFTDLFGNLLRRLSMLAQFHTASSLETDFRALTNAAHIINAYTRLQWRDLTRYSARQKTTMQMGGVVGEIILQDQEIEPFWPYLWVGQWVHAGSGATMGLGAYTLSASLPPGV